ncbi:hypothetical protein [Streptomyces sp. NPDC001843]|uniref:hypothetical protein n=1 Tax=Streptomyces sp. NPDC001843 TaxID=3364617 RepID=UPI0036913BA5
MLQLLQPEQTERKPQQSQCRQLRCGFGGTAASTWTEKAGLAQDVGDRALAAWQIIEDLLGDQVLASASRTARASRSIQQAALHHALLSSCSAAWATAMASRRS